jgi:RNA polymerase sigma-70 factor (ECF subfamily)
VGAAKLLATSEGAELVRRCRKGDGAAWEEIVQTYSRRIYNLAYRFTSRADSAEDLTQEVFIRVYRSLDQYNPKTGRFAELVDAAGAQSHIECLPKAPARAAGRSGR